MTKCSYICNYINEHRDTWEEDFKALYINVKYDGELAIFNYLTNADFSNPIVQEARGIIINLDTLDVVCFPFRKFGNYGESYVDEIDWDSARVQEKVDGSLIKVFYYNGYWHVASNGCISADEAKVNDGSGLSYGDLFDTATSNGVLDYNRLDKDYTYMFELVSPITTIVVKYPCLKVYHLGTRNNKTGQEVVVDIGVDKPKEYRLNSLEDCIKASKMLNSGLSLDSLEDEGFVVVDKDFHRIKVKSEKYIEAHYLTSVNNVSTHKLINIIRLGETEELCTYFTPLKDRVTKIIDCTNNLINDIVSYATLMEDELKAEQLTRKDFYFKHKDDEYFSFVVSYIFGDHEISVEDYVKHSIEMLSSKKLEEILEKKYNLVE